MGEGLNQAAKIIPQKVCSKPVLICTEILGNFDFEQKKACPEMDTQL
jgi:hypothetical protein